MGAIRQAVPAARFDRTVTPVGAPAPSVGAHSREILHDAGLGDDAIEALTDAGVVRA